MAGNKKPRKKYNPDKRPKRVLDMRVMLNHSFDTATLYKLNAPIDMSLLRLQAGKGSFVDWSNIWYRTQIAYQLAINFYKGQTAEDIKALFPVLEAIKERNVVFAGKNVHEENWFFTQNEFTDFMDLHNVTNQIHKDLHADNFLPVYRHVSPLMQKVIDDFMAKYPPSPAQAKVALEQEAIV